MGNTALLIVDIQAGFFNESDQLYKVADLLANLKTLIAKARTAEVPVIYVQHEGSHIPVGSDGWQIHPAITPLETDLIIHKQTPDSFYETDLQAQLTTLDISDLVITGFQTQYCVDTTCRRARSLDYRVTLVKDAHSTYDSPILTAEQIIAHHNRVLDGWFVRLQATEEVQFEAGSKMNEITL